MAKIIIINKKGWLGHPKGSRIDTEKMKRLKKENAKSKKVSNKEKAIT